MSADLFDEDLTASSVPIYDMGPSSRMAEANTTQLPIYMQFNDGNMLTIVTLSVLMVISAAGNITVLVILLERRRRARSRINSMLMHLAIADLLVTFLMMPLEIGWNATVVWLAGDFLCRTMMFFRAFGLYLSSFVLVCISVDRYYAVLRPMQISDSRGKIMICGAWIAAVLCSVPQPFVFHVAEHPNHTWYENCVTFDTFTDKTQEFVYWLAGTLLNYFIPLIVIIFSYASIIVEIFKRSRQPVDDRLRRSSLGYLGKAKIRTLKMTVIIVSVFIICWTPYYIMCIWYWIDHSSALEVDQKVQKGLFLFASTNSCMNPIVYGAFNIRTRRSTTQVDTSTYLTYSKRSSLRPQQTTTSRLGALGGLRLVSWANDENDVEPSRANELTHANGGISRAATASTICSNCGGDNRTTTNAKHCVQTTVPDVTVAAMARERAFRRKPIRPDSFVADSV